MNYNSVLSAIDTYMVESGIRQYCRETCKGQCCAGTGCPRHENSDVQGCAAKLVCIAAFCDEMYAHIYNQDMTNGEAIWDVIDKAHDQLVAHILTFTRDNPYVGDYDLSSVDIDITQEELDVLKNPVIIHV